MRPRISKTHLILVATLVWAVAWFAASISWLVADASMRSMEIRHAIKHVLAEPSEEGHPEARAYFETQWHALNRSALGHAATATLLGAVSIWAFRRAADRKH